MLKKKKNEELTSEEYRQKAQEQIDELKNQWKIFLRTGLIVIAAVIAIIAASIAWFVNNSRVDATGAAIQAAGGEFDIAAAGADTGSATGKYDDLLEASAGAETTVQDKKYLSTAGSHTSIRWAITDKSNMGNTSNGLGIEPGSSGSMTFYIIPHKDGSLKVGLNLTLTGYSVEASAEEANTADSDNQEKLAEADNPTQQLLEGHILLFAGYDSGSKSYSGWISEDAGTWTINSGENKEIFLSRNDDGELVWSTKNAVKDTAYPVTIYWIWPEMLESYLMKTDSYTGRRPLLFPKDASDPEDSSNNSGSGLDTLPENLFEKMCNTKGVEGAKNSNRYFLWENETTFQKTVTPKVLSQIRNNFNPVIYRSIANYYDLADQYLGSNVKYVKLKLEAQ